MQHFIIKDGLARYKKESDVGAIIIFVNRRRKAIPFLTLLLAILIVTGLAGCASNTSPSTPVPTSTSLTLGGFSLTVSVSNTRPKLRESVVIITALKNINNTNLPVNAMGGETSVEITNQAGKVVWSMADWRSGTTLTAPIAIGWQFEGNFTWVVNTQTNTTVSITPGKYYLRISDTDFLDPASKTPSIVGPIEIQVSN